MRRADRSERPSLASEDSPPSESGIDHTALTRYVSDLRVRQITWLTEHEKRSLEDANAALASFDAFAEKFSANCRRRSAPVSRTNCS